MWPTPSLNTVGVPLRLGSAIGALVYWAGAGVHRLLGLHGGRGGWGLRVLPRPSETGVGPVARLDTGNRGSKVFVQNERQ